MKSIKNIFIKVIVVFAICLPALSIANSQVLALNCTQPATAQEAIECGACGASSNNNCESQSLQKNGSDAATSIGGTIKRILNLMSAIVATIAVIMIVVGGARYVTSGGKQDSVAAAKTTIIYAIVGLIVVSLAQVVVHFVLNNVT